MNSEFPMGEAVKAQKPGRSLLRIESWWLPKVSPALGIGYCAALFFRVPGWAALRSIATIAFVALCVGGYGYILNDVMDLDIDRTAGKPNRMAAYSSGQQVLFCALAVGLGFAAALVGLASRTTLLVLGLEYLILTVYSAPPLRLKVRGVLGLLCDASGAHVVSSLYVISTVADRRTAGTSAGGANVAVFVALVCAWELCLGLIGILVHQVEDRDNDLRAGIRTFATKTPFSAMRIPMSLIYLGELLTFASFCIALRHLAPLIGISAGLYCVLLGIKVRKEWPHYRNIDSETILMEWWRLSHTYFESYFPLAAVLQLVWIYPTFLAFAVLHLTVFYVSFREQFHNLRFDYSSLILGGHLLVEPHSSARVRAVLFPRPARRIEVGDGELDFWKVRAVRAGLAIRSGQQYRINLKVRADRSRTILFGVWQNHEPWETRGYCEQLCLSSKWQHVQREFTANDDEPHGYLGLWLGGDPGSVEVRCWSISAVGPRVLARQENVNG